MVLLLSCSNYLDGRGISRRRLRILDRGMVLNAAQLCAEAFSRMVEYDEPEVVACGPYF